MNRLLKISGTMLLILTILIRLEDIFSDKDDKEPYQLPQEERAYNKPPDTIYIIQREFVEKPKKKKKKQEEEVEVQWLFPPGNQRLNIPPGSGLEREWQNSHRKTYTPDYELIPVETNQ